MTLEKHPIWEIFPAAESFESFQEKILRPVYLKTEVPDDIKQFAAVVEKLLCHSYFEYEFIDVALMHAIFTFEKALRIRWKEIHGEKTKLTFEKLIDWFSGKSSFEIQNENAPHTLRRIRNGNVHEETKSLGGVVFIQTVYSTFDLINDLYEDAQLRIQRKKDRIDLAEKFAAFTVQGTILTFNNKRLIVFAIYPAFLNNKSTPPTLTILCVPIFDMSPFENGRHITPPSFPITISNWQFSDEHFEGIDVSTGEMVCLNKIDDINADKYDKWIERYYSFPELGLINFITTNPVDDLFRQELRKLHKG